MHKLFILSLFILMNLAAYAQEKIKCHLKKGEDFAVVEITIKNLRSNYYDQRYAVSTLKTKNPKLLYVAYLPTNKETKLTRILGLVSTINRPLTEKDANWKIDPNNYYEHTRVTDKDKNADKKLIQDSPQYDQLKKEWAVEYKKSLTKTAGLYEDTELEYLLSLKLFHETLPNTYKSWKKDDILNFLYRLSGFQDIQNAIPLKKNFSIANHQYTEKAPARLSLPKVTVPEIKADAKEYPLATFVPRSCYYLEFADIKAFNTALNFGSKHFEQWSKNTYPKTLKQAVNNTLNQCGLLPKILQNPSQYGRIAIAGWDPYYQSGTSLLVIIEKAAPKNSDLAYQKNGYGIFSNSPKLLSMSKSAFEKKRSLFHDPAFIHSRKNLQKSNKEKLFLYLSDYWLTNFLSPRWQILSGRLAECDARIRLTEILRLSTKADRNLKSLPSVKEMKEIYKDHKELCLFDVCCKSTIIP